MAQTQTAANAARSAAIAQAYSIRRVGSALAWTLAR